MLRLYSNKARDGMSYRNLFIYGLFNDAVNTSDNTTSNDRMINELERMRKEAVVA
jgi:hypothetical protein